MIQNQLLEYINAQTKIGVTRDAIRAALIGAGWPAADVDDSLKGAESAMKGPSPVAASVPVGATSAKPEPQVLKVSDLVSASPSLGSSSPSVMPSGTALKDNVKSPLTGPASFPSAKPITPGMSSSMPIGKPITSSMPVTNLAKPRASRGALITEIVLAALFVIAGGAAGFLYYQNNSLTGQLSSLKDESTKVSSELSALQVQMNSSTSALTAQVGTLNGSIQELQNELAFYAVAPGGSVTETSTIVNGTVALTARGSYLITGAYGAKIMVANSKSSSTVAALTPFVGTSTASQFAGTFVPGSGVITLTGVNGTKL